MYEILINVLIFSAIILLLALAVAATQIILILVDARKTARKIEAKIQALTSVFDIVSLIFGGIEGAKKKIKSRIIPKRSTLVALIAGIKKGLEVLLGNKNKGGEE